MTSVSKDRRRAPSFPPRGSRRAACKSALADLRIIECRSRVNPRSVAALLTMRLIDRKQKAPRFATRRLGRRPAPPGAVRPCSRSGLLLAIGFVAPAAVLLHLGEHRLEARLVGDLRLG